MKGEITEFRTQKEGLTPLERARVGDWYWVTFEDTKWDNEKEESVVTGTHEELMCVSHIGSNHFVLERA